MHQATGVGLIAAGAAAGLVTAFVLWRRLPAALAIALAAACGAAIGAGALLVQERAGFADWAVALTALAALSVAHDRAVFGPAGRHARERERP